MSMPSGSFDLASSTRWIQLFNELAAEVGKQNERFARYKHDPQGWFAVLGEEFGEVAREVTAYLPPRGREPSSENYRHELLQVAAVAVRTIWGIDCGELKPTAHDLAELLVLGLETDGSHHKQWVLEQIAERLGLELPEHEQGIAP